MSRQEFKAKSDFEKWVRTEALKLRRPMAVLLDGDLGAGKTQAVRWFCSSLGVDGTASPTFAIHHEYQSRSGAIDHVDLYRIKDDQDLENSGFWDLLKKPAPLLFVEWAGRLPEEVWPADWQVLYIRIQKGDHDEARVVDWELKTP